MFISLHTMTRQIPLKTAGELRETSTREIQLLLHFCVGAHKEFSCFRGFVEYIWSYAWAVEPKCTLSPLHSANYSYTDPQRAFDTPQRGLKWCAIFALPFAPTLSVTRVGPGYGLLATDQYGRTTCHVCR